MPGMLVLSQVRQHGISSSIATCLTRSLSLRSVLRSAEPATLACDFMVRNSHIGVAFVACTACAEVLTVGEHVPRHRTYHLAYPPTSLRQTQPAVDTRR